MALIEARLGLVHPKAVVRAKPETEEIRVVTIDAEFIGVFARLGIPIGASEAHHEIRRYGPDSGFASRAVAASASHGRSISSNRRCARSRAGPDRVLRSSPATESR